VIRLALDSSQAGFQLVLAMAVRHAARVAVISVHARSNASMTLRCNSIHPRAA
jgi:hypothetical protein